MTNCEASSGGLGLGAMPVGLHPLPHVLDLLDRQQAGAADLEAAVELPGQGLDLDREPHGLVERRAGRDHPVVLEQAGRPVLQRRDGVDGQASVPKVA